MHARFPHPMLSFRTRTGTHPQILLVTDGWEDAHEDAPVDVYTRNVVYIEVL